MEGIKLLRKRYYNALKRYYGNGSIIFKMNFNRRKYDAEVEACWAFMTCMVGEFKDERIMQVYERDRKKAVELLQARAKGLWYTASVLHSMLDYPVHKTSQREALSELNSIKTKLLELALQDKKVSNYWALMAKMPKLELEALEKKEVEKNKA